MTLDVLAARRRPPPVVDGDPMILELIEPALGRARFTWEQGPWFPIGQRVDVNGLIRAALSIAGVELFRGFAMTDVPLSLAAGDMLHVTTFRVGAFE